MRVVTATITQRNQVTIPAEVRSLLGLGPQDNVTFTIGEDGDVHLAAAPFNLESAFGSVNPTSDGEDFKHISRVAKETKAEQTARELHEALATGHQGHPPGS